MATFNELMQKYVNSDYETLVHLAQQALVNLLPICKKVDTDNDGLFMTTSIILSAIAADGVLTGLEKKMLKDALGQDDATIQKFISMYDSRMVELILEDGKLLEVDCCFETCVHTPNCTIAEHIREELNR